MKNFILIAVLLLVGTTYGQSYGYSSGLNYSNVTGVSIPTSPSVARANKAIQNFNSPVGAVSYSALSSINKKSDKLNDIAYVSDKINETSRKNIEVRKANTMALVKYNGKYSSIKLVDAKGKEVKTKYNEDYKGLIVPRKKEAKNYYLEVKVDDESKTFYHQVTL